MLYRTFASLALCAGLTCAPAIAAAAYFITPVPSSIGPVTCTTTGISVNTPGTMYHDLPAASDNTIMRVSFNGGPVSMVGFDTINPPSGSYPISTFNLGFPAVSLPYTLHFDVFPALNGNPVGIGYEVDVQCPAGGPGSLTWSIVSLEKAAPVPTASEQALIGLAALLALTGAWLARRRARPVR
ncbi:MAG: hypothetical protein U1F64_13150 [Burkholderiales bacterium]